MSHHGIAKNYNRTNGWTLATALFVTALVAIAPGPAAAQDPPAVETVCDTVRDATPGLFGLCNAYCEAQDCTSEDYTSHQCLPPNQRILDNYDRMKEPTDPAMPCLLPTNASCPCFTLEEILKLNLPAINCRGEDIFGSGPDCDGDANTASDFDAFFVSRVVIDVGGKVGKTNTCFYRDVADTTDPVSCGTIILSRTAPRTITEEQAQVCWQLLTPECI